ncbi:MAG: sigma-54-dependent Fis family transcriptional regulator [Alphaproteobacteria bacterium]|nr:sigma-54-dependent Fis family transcriptional regulator [Alphaproteobacteria bacterium]
MKKSILIVDDTRSERRIISSILRRNLDTHVREAENGREALDMLDQEEISLIILDLEMPVMGGLEALKRMNARYPHIPVIILTGDTDTESTVKAMKLGAADFLCKPVEAARLDVSVNNALKISLMSREISRLKRHTDDCFQFSDLIGFAGGLQENIKTGRKAAACDLPVLLTGETGTGKEMFARAIHGEGSRAGQPFIAVNCGAIPEKLVESTLFGHEKGSFTGAVSKATGKFQEASGGTVFLDEIGELPLDAQVKLLRVLQQHEVEPVGAGRPVPVNVRVVSATNRDLVEEVRAGRFREDLYFRLNVLHIGLLPLRERKQDIPVMVLHFVEQFCAAHGTLPRDVTPEAMDKLCRHNWPGNVRELENMVSRAMALCEGELLTPDDFSFVESAAKIMQGVGDSAGVGIAAQAQQGEPIFSLHADGSFKTMREFEQEIIALALAYHQGNMTKTAHTLGIAKSTLYTKIEALAG